MNGVSHMLPFVVGGGILIALAFLIDGFGVDMASLSAEERSAFGSITPVAAMLKSIGSTAFSFMLPVLLVLSQWQLQTVLDWRLALSVE